MKCQVLYVARARGVSAASELQQSSGGGNGDGGSARGNAPGGTLDRIEKAAQVSELVAAVREVLASSKQRSQTVRQVGRRGQRRISIDPPLAPFGRNLVEIQRR